MTNAEIWEIARAQSATDCGCAPEDFYATSNVVCTSRETPGARAYLKLPHVCDLVSYGSNIVASCAEGLEGVVRSYLDSLEAVQDAFETPAIYRLNDLLASHGARVLYQASYFLPDVDAIHGAELSCPFELRVLEAENFRDLYVPAWSNALCKDRPQLDVLGVGAYDGGALVGLAGCSADCERMWQIGVDVLPSYRRKGIAAALTNQLARETFARGKVPFYCAAWSNVKSVRNALASGFKPAWAQATARPISEAEGGVKPQASAGEVQ